MSHRIRIRHPGYHGQNTLFTLPARDGSNHDRAHYATVKAACSVVTDNEDQVLLSHNASSTSSVAVDADGLIPAGDYFLHLPSIDVSRDTPYPIVPNFRAWEFPHDAFPQIWQDASRHETLTSQTTASVLDAVPSENCRITANRLACEDAHIIPGSEKAWFTSNEMDAYGQMSGRSGDTVADTWVNKMRLQAQAHRLWDNLQFVIVPRKISTDSEELAWYTQMMNEDDELQRDWHCKRLQSLQGRACQFLHGRFAYGIFPRLHAFLQGGQPRWLAVRQPDGTKSVRLYSVAECREFTIAQGRGRSASPTKRARSATDGPADSFCLGSGGDCEKAIDLAECSDGDWRSGSFDSADSAIGGITRCRSDRRKMSRSSDILRDWSTCSSASDIEYERGRKRLRM